jgi:hypothetical protein
MGKGMVEHLDAEEVLHFAFESPGGERMAGECRELRVVGIETDHEFDATIGCRRDKQVDDS